MKIYTTLCYIMSLTKFSKYSKQNFLTEGIECIFSEMNMHRKDIIQCLVVKY